MDTTEITRRMNHFNFYKWLLDRDGDPQNEMRQEVLFHWAYEMALFQEEANRTGEPIDYYQRGKVVRTIQPERKAA
jgi:hypothetical protein